MKHRIPALLLLLFLLLSLSACQRNAPGYTPSGEIYVKTSPSRGDAGVSEVVDIELEKRVYTSNGDLTLPISVGVGHLPISSPEPSENDYAYLLISVWHAFPLGDEPAQTVRIDFPDWHTDKYEATEQEEVFVFLFPAYGEFYPRYRETVELAIPGNATEGRISAELHIVENGNHYTSKAVRVDFHRDGDRITFAE